MQSMMELKWKEQIKVVVNNDADVDKVKIGIFNKVKGDAIDKEVKIDIANEVKIDIVNDE